MANLVPRCLDFSCQVRSGCVQKLLWGNLLYGRFVENHLYLRSYGTLRAGKISFPIQNSKSWNPNLYGGLYGEISVTWFSS